MQGKTKLSKTLDNHFYFHYFQFFISIFSIPCLFVSSAFFYSHNLMFASIAFLAIGILNFIYFGIAIFNNSFDNQKLIEELTKDHFGLITLICYATGKSAKDLKDIDDEYDLALESIIKLQSNCNEFHKVINLLDRYIAEDEEEGRTNNNLYQEAKKILDETKT